MKKAGKADDKKRKTEASESNPTLKAKKTKSDTVDKAIENIKSILNSKTPQ